MIDVKRIVAGFRLKWLYRADTERVCRNVENPQLTVVDVTRWY